MSFVTMRTLGNVGNAGSIQTAYSGTVRPDSNGYVNVDVRDIGTMQLAGFTLGSGANNTAATTDPTANDDEGDGYAPGSIWINQTYPRIWTNTVATPGAAVWQLLFQKVGVS